MWWSPQALGAISWAFYCPESSPWLGHLLPRLESHTELTELVSKGAARSPGALQFSQEIRCLREPWR